MPSNHKLVCARAARHEFGEAFQRAIGDYRGARLAATTWTVQLNERFPDGIPLLPLSFLYGDLASFAWDGSVTLDNAGDVTSHFRVMARARPLQPEEIEDDCYESSSIEEANKSVVVHDGRVHRDGRTLYSQHSRFCLDKVFGKKHNNSDVFSAAAKPLLDSAVEGSRATLVFFGQTGTGKTHTAQGVLDIMTPAIFMQVACVEVLCYELAGTRGGREAVFDLLADRATVKCLTGEDGNVHVRGARAIRCNSSEELLEAVRSAFSWRTSESTERNEASSRSHCILELQFPTAQLAKEASADQGTGGVLRVIDLAGSERNFETQLHTKSMAERGGHINYSLLMLKECARIMHLNRRRRDAGKSEAHVPFRSTRLTHLLKCCFTDESHKTTVVGTLSPSPTDVEHSLNTLQHVGMMRSARAWESFAGEAAAQQTAKEKGFHQVEGRGHALHSKQQDARKEQLDQFQFTKVLQAGGSIMRKYEPENMKTEAFIDERWHRELNVKVEEDLWVLKDADAECTQILTSWREEKWTASKMHDLVRWDAPTLQAFLRSLSLPGEARIPSTMTGAQVRRLGRRGLLALCSDEATGQMLYDALQGEEQASKAAAASHRGANAKITALGHSKVYAVLPEQPQRSSLQGDPKDTGEAEENSEMHET